MNNFIIERMELKDLDEVLKIENELFGLGAWSRNNYEYELTSNEFSHMFLLKHNNEVIGYLGVWIIYHAAQITTIAIAKKWQGKKLANLLIEQAIALAKFYQSENITLEVRVSNIKAQNLYHKYGFKVASVRKNYYSDTGEDAYLMMKNMLGE